MTLYFNNSESGIIITNYNRSTNFISEDGTINSIVITAADSEDIFSLANNYSIITSIKIANDSDVVFYELNNINYIITSVSDQVQDNFISKVINLNPNT